MKMNEDEMLIVGNEFSVQRAYTNVERSVETRLTRSMRVNFLFFSDNRIGFTTLSPFGAAHRFLKSVSINSGGLPGLGRRLVHRRDSCSNGEIRQGNDLAWQRSHQNKTNIKTHGHFFSIANRRN